MLKSFLPMLKPAMESLVEMGDTIELNEGEGHIALMIFKGPDKPDGKKGEALLAVVAMCEKGSTVRRIINKGPVVETLTNLATKAQQENER